MTDHTLEAPYVVVDVFTDRQFGGNQLAVITDARGLSDGQMQGIANEFHFSETTFVLPPDDGHSTARVRIFTGKQEVPFAGHPNVGTAFVLGRLDSVFGVAVGETMRFEEAAGLVEVALIRDAGAVVGAAIRAPRPLEVGAVMDPAALAGCIGVGAGDIVLRHHEPRLLSVGLPFYVGEVEPAALSRSLARLDVFRETADRYGLADLSGRFSVFVYARLGEGCGRLRARMFAPLSGTFEDPATGSASAALGAYLASLDPMADGTLSIDIEQGVEMGRPSAIGLEIRKSGGQVAEVKVIGRCVQTMRGTLGIDGE